MPMVSTSGLSRAASPVMPGAPGIVIVFWLAEAVSGSVVAALTPVTPGMAVNASSIRCWTARTSGAFGKN